MSAVPKRKLTPDEYLAIERQAEFKSEYYNGETFAMAGASYPHNVVKENLVVLLGRLFAGGPCRTLSSDQRVKVEGTGLYTYPDVIIQCEPPRFEDRERDTLLNPRAIIEVLSPSTESYDRGGQASHYRRISSLAEYLLVSQRQPLVERYVRQPDGSWALTEFDGLDAVVPLTSVPAQVPLAEVYRDVVFPEVTLR